jgi:hypothetical protein
MLLPSSQSSLVGEALQQFTKNDTVANQTTGMASIPTPIPSQRQRITVPDLDAEDRIAPTEQHLAQQEGHRLEGSDSSEESFDSALESIISNDTQRAMAFLINRVAQLETSVRAITLERDSLQGLASEITSEREKLQSLESEITLERDKLRVSESSIREIALDHDKLRCELDMGRRQLETARRNSVTLERQVQDLHLKSLEGAKDLKRRVTDLTAKVRDHESGQDYTQAYQQGVRAGMRSQFYTDELLKQVEAYKAEAAKWRNAAYGQGSEAVSRCWQASVDEAVRREREKDAFVIKALRDEITALKSKKEG